MTTAENILQLWQQLSPREREAVFAQVAKEPSFSAAVRAEAAQAAQPIYANYREALRAAFGPSADNIPGTDPQVGTLTDVPVYALRVVLNEGPGFHQGRTFVYCGGGEVFAAMNSAGSASKLCFYLVRDDSDGRTWERERARIDAAHAAWREGTGAAVPAADWTTYHAGRPSAQYRVVASI